MFTSIRIFALKKFFLTCCFISNRTKLKKSILKLSSIYLCIKLEIKQHVRQDKYSKKFLEPLMASWSQNICSIFALLFFEIIILLLPRCTSASDWLRDWWTTNQNDCLISSYDVLSVSWELRKHKVHCTLSHYPTCTWILTIKIISKLPVCPKLGRFWIKQLCWGQQWGTCSMK